VQWLFPPSGDTVASTFTGYVRYGNFTGTAAGNLKIVAVGGTDTLTLYDDTVVLAASGGTLILPLEFTGPPADDDYTLYVTLTGIPGEAASTSSLITLEAAMTPSDPPVVEITAPVTGTAAVGSLAVTVTATDDVSVWRVALLVDGANPQYLFAPTSGDDYEFTLDVSALTNGSHTVTAYARDSENQLSDPDSITIIVSNLQADVERLIYTKQMGRNADHTVVGAESANWRDVLYRRIIEVLDLPAAEDLPEDPRYCYNVFLYYILDSDSADLSLYTRWDPAETSHAIPASRTIKWCLRFLPQLTTASFDIACTTVLRFATASNGDPLLLCATPNSIQRYSLQAGTLSQFADLSDLSSGGGMYYDPYWQLEPPTDIAACGGKVFVASAEYIYVYDENSGDLTQRLQFWPDVIASVDALATDGTVLYIAATLDAGGSRLYRYTFDAPKALCDHDETVNFLEWAGGALYGGNTSGDLLVLSNDAWTVAHATGQDGLYALAENGATLYCGTGDAGQVFAKLSSWGPNWTSGFTAVSGLAEFRGFMYAGGTGTGAQYLWYEATPGGWVQSLDTDDDVTAIADLLTVADDDGHEQLFVAAIAAAECRLYRIELAPSSSMVSGTTPPDINFKVLA